MAGQPLWVCGRCGRGFANRNQPHACGRYELDHHFRGKPAEIRILYDAFAAMLSRIGPVTVLPEKTRIAFQVRMSFAQVSPRRGWLDGHFVLARRAEAAPFRKIETISARNHVHFFRLTRSEDIAELEPFAQEAYRVGAQEHLRKRRPA
jgi:hypothetical protein